MTFDHFVHVTSLLTTFTPDFRSFRLSDIIINNFFLLMTFVRFNYVTLLLKTFTHDFRSFRLYGIIINNFYSFV